MPSFGTCFGRRRPSAPCKRTFRVTRPFQQHLQIRDFACAEFIYAFQWNIACLGSSKHRLKQKDERTNPSARFAAVVLSSALRPLRAGADARYADARKGRSSAALCIWRPVMSFSLVLVSAGLFTVKRLAPDTSTCAIRSPHVQTWPSRFHIESCFDNREALWWTQRDEEVATRPASAQHYRHNHSE
jgi:hypothetical protein